MQVTMRRAALIAALVLLVLANVVLTTSVLAFGVAAVFLSRIRPHGVSDTGLFVLVAIEAAALFAVAWITRVIWHALRRERAR
jgi:hypothetical protein